MGRRIADLEGRIGEPSRARRLDQRLGDVDAQHMAALAPTALASSAVVPPVPQPTSSTRSPGCALAAVERDLAEARDAALDAVVGAQPHRAAGAFPVGRLLGGQLVLGLHALLPPCAITISRGM